MTNFERIKNMTVEEMAEMIFNDANNGYYYCNYCSYQSFYAPHCTAVEIAQSCKKAIAKWLESEVQDDE